MLRVAIVGAGVMGSNHGRILSVLPDVEVSAVVDSDPERGKKLADRLGAHYVDTTSSIADLAQAAIIATPTVSHEELGVELLEAGLHLLVEKPLAATVAGCERLIDAAEKAGRHLLVGHVERYNSAFLDLERIIQDVVHIEIARMGPYPARINDSVVMDLMVHDFDLARALARSSVRRVSAVGQGRRSGRCELACALLEFTNGVTASVTASHLGQHKIRRMEVTQSDSVVIADLVREEIAVHRMTQLEYAAEDGVRYRQTSVTETPYLNRHSEPLFLELRHFVNCITNGESPRVTASDGLAAVSLAVEVQGLISKAD